MSGFDTIPKMPKEPSIIVNSELLTGGQSMALRVAASYMLMAIDNGDLGKQDEQMNAYRERLGEVLKIMLRI